MCRRLQRHDGCECRAVLRWTYGEVCGSCRPGVDSDHRISITNVDVDHVRTTGCSVASCGVVSIDVAEREADACFRERPRVVTRGGDAGVWIEIGRGQTVNFR